MARSPVHSRVAQLAEQPAVNRQVPSSSLGAGAQQPRYASFDVRAKRRAGAISYVGSLGRFSDRNGLDSVAGTRGGSSAGQSSGLIIRRSWVRAPAAPQAPPAPRGRWVVPVMGDY